MGLVDSVGILDAELLDDALDLLPLLMGDKVPDDSLKPIPPGSVVADPDSKRGAVCAPGSVRTLGRRLCVYRTACHAGRAVCWCPWLLLQHADAHGRLVCAVCELLPR